MTFSIVARDRASGSVGVAVATTVAAVGALAPHVSLSSAVSTQAFVNVDLGIRVMELTHLGVDVEAAIRRALDTDPDAEMRQISGIGWESGAFAWTGSKVLDVSGHFVAEDHVVAGNLLTSRDVLTAMSESFAASAGEEFVSRLIAALDAGLRAGGERDSADFGEVYGSAAVQVASRQPRAFHNLRVDASLTGIADLRQVYERALHSTIELERFYDGAIVVRPTFWRIIDEGRDDA